MGYKHGMRIANNHPTIPKELLESYARLALTRDAIGQANVTWCIKEGKETTSLALLPPLALLLPFRLSAKCGDRKMVDDHHR